MAKYKKYIFISTVAFALFVFWVANNAFSIEERIDEENFATLNNQSHLKNSNIGKGFIFEGYLVDKYLNKKFGIISLKTKHNKIKNFIEITILPNLGKLKINPLPGDLIRVVGLLDKYKNKFQIKPLDIKSLSITRSKKSCEKPVPLEKVNFNYKNKYIEIAPVVGISAKPFRSKKGKEHLRLRVRWGQRVVGGIMWEGKWSQNDIKLIRSGGRICLFAKIGKYKRELSLETVRIFKQK